MIKRTLIIFLFLISTFVIFSQEVNFNTRCALAYENIPTLRFNEAEALLDQEEDINPGNAYVSYIRNYMDFVRLFVSQDKKLYDQLSHRKSDYFSTIEQLDDTCRYKKWMLGNMHLQWSMNKIVFGDFITGAIEFSRAYYLIEENKANFPDFKPNLLSMGVLHVIAGLVPDKYEWLLGLLSMKGDVARGKKELSDFLVLTKQQESLKQFYPETLFYMGFIELNIHPDRDRLNRILKNSEQINDSVLLLKFLELNIFMRTGNNDDALALLQKTDTMKQVAYPFAYLDYLHGECLLRSLNSKDALNEYNLFLKTFKGENYIKDTWRKKAWAAFLAGDTAAYLTNMKQVKERGSARLEVDKEALSEAQSGQLPDKTLLKARLLFDGGYYAEVLDILKQADTLLYSGVQKVNFVYRLGRTYDQLKRYDLAKKYYKLVLERGSAMKNYYAANAALKLGGIYEREGDLKLAEKNYRMCLDINSEPYRNSIRARAKEGLKRLSEK